MLAKPFFSSSSCQLVSTTELAKHFLDGPHRCRCVPARRSDPPGTCEGRAEVQGVVGDNLLSHCLEEVGDAAGTGEGAEDTVEPQGRDDPVNPGQEPLLAFYEPELRVSGGPCRRVVRGKILLDRIGDRVGRPSAAGSRAVSRPELTALGFRNDAHRRLRPYVLFGGGGMQRGYGVGVTRPSPAPILRRAMKIIAMRSKCSAWRHAFPGPLSGAASSESRCHGDGAPLEFPPLTSPKPAFSLADQRRIGRPTGCILSRSNMPRSLPSAAIYRAPRLRTSNLP